MELQKLVGANLRRFRNSAAITQEDLAHRAAIDRTYLSDIERGISNPTVGMLQKLATILGVHPAVMLVPADREEAVRAALSDV